jgi:hypothetical protein
MHSMEKTNTDAHEIEIICPATEMKVLKYIAGKWVILIQSGETWEIQTQAFFPEVIYLGHS